MRAFDIAVAIRPDPEFLDDPRGQPQRAVVQPEGQRLGPRALNDLIAGFLR